MGVSQKDQAYGNKLLTDNAAKESDIQGFYNFLGNDEESKALKDKAKERLGQFEMERAKAAKAQQDAAFARQKDMMGNQAGDAARKALAGQMAGVKTSANQRGLLYSGARQAGEVGAQAQAAGNLAAKKQEINQATEQQMGQQQQTQLGQAQNQQQLTGQKNASDYQEALKRKRSGEGVAGAIGKGAGDVLGAIFPF